jgi:amino acid transporter
MGWDYAIQWLTILPFEISAAGLTINFWHEYNIGIWIAVFLTVLSIIQIFGVRGYGEGEPQPAHGIERLSLNLSLS